MIQIPSDYWHIAIDPGASGGIAWKNGDGPMTAVPMPQEPTDTVKLLSDLVLKGYTVLHIEQLPRFVPMGGGKGIPGSMAAVMFENFGIVLGAAMALGYRIERVPPQTWQKELGLGNSKGLSKDRVEEQAQGPRPGALSRHSDHTQDIGLPPDLGVWTKTLLTGFLRCITRSVSSAIGERRVEGVQ
jgi:hypothetical protein